MGASIGEDRAQAFMKPLEGLQRRILVTTEQPPLCRLIFYREETFPGSSKRESVIIAGSRARQRKSMSLPMLSEAVKYTGRVLLGKSSAIEGDRSGHPVGIPLMVLNK